MKIADVEIGAGHPVAVCAELSANHGGSLIRAKQLIEAAKDAGANLVKLQAFTLDEILALRGEGQAPAPWDHLTKGELYTQALTPLEWLPELFGHAASLGIVCFSSVFGYDSLAALERLRCPAYKIAKSDSGVDWLRAAARSTGKPVLVSVAGDGQWEIYSHATMYCPEGYPAAPDTMKLSRLTPQAFGGLSCHCLDPMIPPMAVARGACYLEYHLMLEREAYAGAITADHVAVAIQMDLPLDAAFSHTPGSFKAMVESVRKAEAILG